MMKVINKMFPCFVFKCLVSLRGRGLETGLPVSSSTAAASVRTRVKTCEESSLFQFISVYFSCESCETS